MNYKYFGNVQTIEELKKEYRQLAKKYHPDRNQTIDTNQIMSDINNEYERIFKQLETNSERPSGHKVDDVFRQIIDKLSESKYDSLNIDIVGTWLWISGQSYELREDLKELGFKWSKSNKKWYYGEYSEKRRGRLNWEEKVNKYGQTRVKDANSKTIKRLAQ